MDVYVKLPAELQLRVLESFPSYEDAVAFSKSSLLTWNFFKRHKVSILSAHVSKDLEGGLMQDALAIMSFPAVPDPLNEEAHTSAVHRHLTQWGCRKLPDPTDSPADNLSRILDLKSLCDWIWTYLDDFLGKARSWNVERAYAWLPSWSPHAWFTCYRICIGETATWPVMTGKAPSRFDRTTLTLLQRRHMFQAFLRYELLCLIYGSGGTDESFKLHLQDTNQHYSIPSGLQPLHDATIDHSLNPINGHNMSPATSPEYKMNHLYHFWDWHILSKYEGTSIYSPKVQLLPCVRDYHIALYEAMRAKGPHSDARYKPLDWPYYGIYDRDPAEDSLLACSGLNVLTLVLLGKSGTEHFLARARRSSRWGGNNLLQTDVVNVNTSLRDKAVLGKGSWRPDPSVQLYRQRCGPLWKGDLARQILEPEDEYMDQGELIVHGRGVLPIHPAVKKPFWKQSLKRSGYRAYDDRACRF